MTWHDVGIVIRSVRAAREREATTLLQRVMRFAHHAAISWHGEGRTVPQSYADALAFWCGHGAPLWTLQLEDDAVLAPDFEEHASRFLLEAAADRRVGLVSFYSGRRLPPANELPSPPILERMPGAKFLMAQAIAFPTALVLEHNAFMIEFTRDRPYATDTATAAWLKSKGLRLARAWPSIVQHADLPSLSGHRRNPNRFSQSYEARYGR